MAESRYTITKLNADNYFNWRYKMQMLLTEKGVWKAITGNAPDPVTDAWTEGDQKAHATIALNVDDGQIQHIRNCITARAAWEALKEFHEKDSPGNRVYILRKIMRLRLEEGGDIEEHVSKLNELFQKLLALGDNITPDFFKCATLLGSLPESYDSLVIALEACSEELTSAVVISKVMAEYKRRTERNTETKSGVALRVGSSSKTKTKVCYFCKGDGHYKSECSKYKAWLSKKKEKCDGQQKANLTESGNDDQFLFTTSLDNGWIVDSGATCHIVGQKQQFVYFNKNHREEVYVANGQQMSAEGKGTIRVNFINKFGNRTSVEIADVLFIPEIKGNLISVKRLAEKGYKVNFNDKQCEISKGDKQVAVGDISGNLYKLRTPNTICIAESSETQTKGCVHEWHRILGHRDIEVVKSLTSGKFVNAIEYEECIEGCKNILNCSVCLEGKMSKMKFPQKSFNRAKQVMDMVHSDVCGPMQTTSPSGKRYVLTFIDDYSRYAVIYLIKEKSEVFARFQEYMEMCKTMFNRKPKFIRTDRGGEYMSQQFATFLEKEGIQNQRTAPYNPQQNGVAERKNRTLIEMARCMLIESGMEKKFWGEAVTMANYIQNRLPAKDIDKTPFESWFGTKPSIERIKRFGSKCYTFVPDEKRRKLDSKAIPTIFVGFDMVSKASRCYVPATGKVIISRNVKFVNKDSDWKIKADPVQEEQSITIQNKEQDEYFSAAEDLGNDDEGKIQDDQAAINNSNADMPTIGEIRRSTRPNKGQAPKRLIEEVNLVNHSIIEPKCLKEVLESDQKEQWLKAMNDEVDSLIENRTWDLCELPANRKAIGSKWVFKLKTRPDGAVDCFKARLVAQGFSQKFGTDYDLVFAPVVKQTTFRLLLSIAAKEKFCVRHLDAKTAFLNGKLEENIYMKQPPGFIAEGKENHMCLLRRSIYGLKQSARVWNKTIHQVLINARYTQSKNDPCLYKFAENGEECFVLLYVDDIVVASKHAKLISECERTLNSNFKIKNLGDIQNYLGLQVNRNADGDFAINQTAYILKVINDFGLADAKISDVPISVSYGKAEKSDLLIDNTKYRQLIGCLLYISVNTRPDISASISILAQKVSGPSQEDWNELKRVLKYLKGTAQLSLALGKSESDNGLIGYADANWAENRLDRKSNSGYVFKYLDGVISWSCRKQVCVALSSTEAEFVALSEACKEASWIRRVLVDFNQTLTKPTTIYEDNQSCLKLIEEEHMSGRSKHIDVRYFFVKDYIDRGLVNCSYCPTENMLADLLTKPLSANRISIFRNQCGISSFE